MFMGRIIKKRLKATHLKDYKPSPFLIESAELQFKLDPKNTAVNAKLKIKRNNLVKKSSVLVLDGINLKLKNIKLNNKPLAKTSYKISPEHLTIKQVPEEFTLETTVIIHPEKNLSCSGLYLSNGNFCTQNEPCGFRHITYFLDRPDVLTKFTVTIVADKKKYPILLSNGNLIAAKNLPNNLHSTTWQDPFPKSAYLFALVAGKYGYLEDHYTTTSGRKITLRIFAQAKQLQQCHHGMFVLKQAMAWEEKTFGLEYDLDIYQIVAIDDFNMGAMENKSLNIFNSNLLLASQTTTTDADFNKIAAVVAHEYFHNWTGNRVTCRDWFQIGLKEGLTTLREQLFMEDVYGYTMNRINSINTIRTKQFTEDAGPLSHPVRLKSYLEINNFYTVTVYYKSAEIARMLSTIFGRASFQQIMREFLSEFDGQPVTIEDFLQTAAKVTKTNLNQFKLWYDQPGTPLVEITDKFSKNKTLTLKVKQKNKSKKNLCIPLTTELLHPDNDKALTKTLLIDKQEKTFSFSKLSSKPIPALLCNFSAPIKVKYPYTDDELLSIMCHSKVPTNAWDASQQLMINVVQNLCKKNQSKQRPPLPPILLQAFKTVLTNNKIDQALAAQLLQLPTESYLQESLPKINLATIHHVSEFIKLELAKIFKKELLACHKKNKTKTYRLDAISIGKRSLKNLCLYYLMHLNTKEVFDICLHQLKESNNLTDTLGCLNALASSNYSKKEQLLDKYYKKWQNQPNLVLKWLAINATIKLPDTLKRVKKLTKHPAFNIKNPNKVYALIRTFCENNHINFHEESGTGYKFLADLVLAIDKFNPQLAAIIVLPLTRKNNLNKTQQKLLQQQLKRIKQAPKTSKNVYEIVSKAIAK